MSDQCGLHWANIIFIGSIAVIMRVMLEEYIRWSYLPLLLSVYENQHALIWWHHQQMLIFIHGWWWYHQCMLLFMHGYEDIKACWFHAPMVLISAHVDFFIHGWWYHHMIILITDDDYIINTYKFSYNNDNRNWTFTIYILFTFWYKKCLWCQRNVLHHLSSIKYFFALTFIDVLIN